MHPDRGSDVAHRTCVFREMPVGSPCLGGVQSRGRGEGCCRSISKWWRSDFQKNWEACFGLRLVHVHFCLRLCSLEFIGLGLPSLGALSLSTFRGVCPCEWPFLSPCQNPVSRMLVSGRWDPSLYRFLRFLFCQHKSQLEMTYKHNLMKVCKTDIPNY